MCNLYRLDTSPAQLARMFGVQTGRIGNAGGEVYPGQPGLVIAEGVLQSMVWGFPLLRRGRSGQPLKPKPVNNTREDKIDSPFWRSSFASRRCLIPMDAFAEAEGEDGGKTRTWFAMPDAPAFICGGIWRDSAEWGRSYSLMMTDANEQVGETHDRMPVIIAAADRERWLNGDVADAQTLCRPYEGTLSINRSDQLWSGR